MICECGYQEILGEDGDPILRDAEHYRLAMLHNAHQMRALAIEDERFDDDLTHALLEFSELCELESQRRVHGESKAWQAQVREKRLRAQRGETHG